ncbi:hypothetical protein ACFL1G_12340, partial [Planctomycetota bacterium]
VERMKQAQKKADEGTLTGAGAIGKGKKAKAEAGEEAQIKAGAKGKQHAQQLIAVDKQIRQGNAKHQDRLARFERIMQLATEQGKTETLDRVRKLSEKEQNRYEQKLQRLEQRRERILQTSEEAQAKPAGKVKEKAEGQVEEEVEAKEVEQVEEEIEQDED